MHTLSFDYSVLDNAGFELYCDCVYADWLIQTGLAHTVRFHGKRFAWFVSDVTKQDFDWLVCCFSTCISSSIFSTIFYLLFD